MADGLLQHWAPAADYKLYFRDRDRGKKKKAENRKSMDGGD